MARGTKSLKLDAGRLAAGFENAAAGRDAPAAAPNSRKRASAPSSSTRKRAVREPDRTSADEPAATSPPASTARKRATSKKVSKKASSSAKAPKAATQRVVERGRAQAARPADPTSRLASGALPDQTPDPPTGQPADGSAAAVPEPTGERPAAATPRMHKVHVNLPLELLARLRSWELDEFARTGKVPSITRLVTDALESIPENPSELLAEAADLDREVPLEQFSTRTAYAAHQRALALAFTHEPRLTLTAIVTVALQRHLDRLQTSG